MAISEAVFSSLVASSGGGSRHMRVVRSLVLLVVAFVWGSPARAAPAYPSRPMQLVVTVPPGGAADFVARIIAAKLADALGQPVIVANRGGAGGTTAAAAVAKADPDGYTLLLNTIATHGIGPHLYANLPYDPVKDFAPVILLARLPLIMTVTAMLPALISQVVVVLKDTAIGYQITFLEMVRQGTLIGAQYSNYIAALFVIAVLMVAVNVTLSWLAVWLERRLRRTRRSAAPPAAARATATDTATDLTPGALAPGAVRCAGFMTPDLRGLRRSRNQWR